MHTVRIHSKRRRQPWLITLLTISCALLPHLSAAAQGDPVSEVIGLVNELRLSNGLPAYTVDAALMSAAQAQASWSAANNHIGHDGPGGSSPDDRAQAAGYGGGELSFATENAAHGTIGYNTPSLVVTMWQSDWGHLNAMISPDYEHIGVGYAEAGDYSWYVMMVGWVGSKAGTGDAYPSGSAEPVTISPFIMSEPDEQGAIYHKVQPGQTSWTIAAYYNVELTELLALNDLTQESILHPGDTLLVRPPDSPMDSPVSKSPTETIPVQHSALAPTPDTQVSVPTPVVTALSSQTERIPILVILGLAIILIAGLGLVRAWRTPGAR